MGSVTEAAVGFVSHRIVSSRFSFLPFLCLQTFSVHELVCLLSRHRHFQEHQVAKVLGHPRHQFFGLLWAMCPVVPRLEKQALRKTRLWKQAWARHWTMLNATRTGRWWTI